MSTSPELTIRVDFNGHDGWEVDLADRRIVCESLDDARRIAFLKAAHRRPCELIVRDAYHRVLERQTIDALNPVAAHAW